MTIVELWVAYRDERSIAVAPTSLATHFLQIEKWLERCPITDPLEGRRILVWVLQQQPHKSARRVAMALKTLYRWAASEDVGLLPRNPIVTFKLPKEMGVAPEVTVIPREQVEDVLLALRHSSRIHRWDLLAAFLLQTGIRTGEAFGLMWADIDFHTNRAHIHQNWTLTHGLRPSTKTGRERWVPLNVKALQVLKEMPRTEERIFPWARQSFMSAFRNSMARLVRAGVIRKRFRPYDLRHSHISRLLEAGIPVTQVASWAGNTSETIWHHYAASTTDYEMPTL